MNNERRKEIATAISMIEEAKSILEQCQADEQDYFDNMPENMQSGDKGQLAEQAANDLQEAVDSLDNVIDSANNAANGG